MTRAVQLSDEAEEDLASAYAWYEDRLVGLGDDFIAAFRSVLRYVAERPLAFQTVHRQFRHLPMRRFPYVIIYKMDAHTVFVYRLFHTHQNPSQWKEGVA